MRAGSIANWPIRLRHPGPGALVFSTGPSLLFRQANSSAGWRLSDYAAGVDTAEDPRSSRARGAALETAAFLFAVIECPRPAAGGSRHALEGIDRVVLGRGPSREVSRAGGRLTLLFPSPWLSSVHAELVRR